MKRILAAMLCALLTFSGGVALAAKEEPLFTYLGIPFGIKQDECIALVKEKLGHDMYADGQMVYFEGYEEGEDWRVTLFGQEARYTPEFYTKKPRNRLSTQLFWCVPAGRRGMTWRTFAVDGDHAAAELQQALDDLADFLQQAEAELGAPTQGLRLWHGEHDYTLPDGLPGGEALLALLDQGGDHVSIVVAFRNVSVGFGIQVERQTDGVRGDLSLRLSYEDWIRQPSADAGKDGPFPAQL